ncbi:uncharacterized protein LOC106076478 [Biomphalaria glabrata]|uniref:Uncharacterized protein LOC106076478 n=1 Tax=Biomphalaria glabrata TaxID=6526 RepID=A0A2C9KWV2_BIOGL|nr:uncharacterized protein LOC106076478 [Biomphalaria glabrata]XP_055874334.1 uncharacterized protein LOC106076478 [Biomphalaria glabrata]XP_055874335.1 uncharacterized protein LOC106076478 [Biomphalaria glabrata]
MSGDGMDRFLQRMRSDLMFELRRIEHGERPVTGQNHRENLQHFFEKNLEPAADRGVGKSNISNHDDIETHRPEAVVVEVQGIIERRPVSSILESPAFRRQLENIIRGSIQNASPTLNRRQAQSQPNRTPSPPIIATSNHEVIQVRQPLSRHASTESLDSFSSAVSSLEDFEDVEEMTSQAVSPRPLGVLPHGVRNNQDSISRPRVQPQQPRIEPQQPRIEPQSPRIEPQPEVSPERVGWNEINIRQRDELVEEISELLHSRLVSSTLNGEFRARLEVLGQEHIRASGTDGRAVEEFVRRLPHAGVPRNDFSHLGINLGAAEADNWETISVTSVSAQSVPYVQTNAYLGRELQSLKAQMNEMKNMLKLTFDLQLDIQRAIRQEVAGAMNSLSVSPPVLSRPINDTHCLICLDHHTDTVLYQCGHMCVCYTCGRDLVNRGHSCPVCRAPIKDVIRAYKTNAD